MKSWWVATLIGVLLGLYGLGMFKWGEWREREAWTASDFRDTVIQYITVPVHVPVQVKPNPVAAKPKPDPGLQRAVDSLIAVTANRDSLIFTMAQSQTAEQEFFTADPTGVQVSGLLSLEYRPLVKHFWTDMKIDTIAVRERIITKTVVEERIAWEWVVAGTSVGIAAGAILIHELEKRDCP